MTTPIEALMALADDYATAYAASQASWDSERDALLQALRAALAQAEAQPAAEPERESRDRVCEEADGCPTEKTVLQRFWRTHRPDAQPAAEPDPWPAELSSDQRSLPNRFNVTPDLSIDDDDFLFDALINVEGDFGEGMKAKYVAEIARRLNAGAAQPMRQSHDNTD